MRNRHWITAGIGLLLLSSCQPNRPKPATIQPSPQAFAEPIVPSQPKALPTLKVPGMIPTSETKTTLMPVAVSSTRDPFAATTIPTTLKATLQPATLQPAAPQSATSPNRNQPVAPIPQPSIAYRPIPPPAPLSAQPLPALPIGGTPNTAPPAPPVSRTNLADAIALTGVIQTGSQLSAIVQDTDGNSRYVQVGESLANGQVTVKRINLNSAGNPSIVLVQNGVELTKLVGQAES
ncbi:hypothetical protein H6F89_22605 [Cyanobacteria bacterium FACHB-63]|nr:hypothetical protein [Cyanobacteria bacterium FACHB-63]